MAVRAADDTYLAGTDGQLRADAELFGEADFGEAVTAVEPKRQTATRSRSTGTRTPRRAAKLTQLQNDIAEEIAVAGAVITPLSPTLGYCIVEDSGTVSAALLKLAQDRPWVLRALERAAEIGAGAQIGKVAVRWGAAFAVDREFLAPDALPAQMLRVTDAYIATHPEAVKETQPQQSQSQPTGFTAPRFGGVRFGR